MNIIFEKMKKLVPIQSCVKARENGDFLIVASNSGEIIYLNETSKDFYMLCNSVNDIETILEQMLAVYEISAAELAEDMVDLVRNMQWYDILELKEGKYDETI